MLTPAEFNAEIEAVKAGQRKAKGRPASPQNSNAATLRALETGQPRLYVGELTPSRLRKLNKWLAANHPELRRKSDETLAKAIRRERAARARRK